MVGGTIGVPLARGFADARDFLMFLGFYLLFAYPLFLFSEYRRRP